MKVCFGQKYVPKANFKHGSERTQEKGQLPLPLRAYNNV